MFLEDRIETPENVELRRKLAGIGQRFLAGLLDNLLIFLVIYLPLLILFMYMGLASLFVDASVMEAIAVTFLIVIVFCVYWGYFLLFELWMNGQTPGKKYMKIRVVREEGQGVTFQAVLIRNLLRVVDGIGGYAVAGISMFCTHKVQRLGDMAAGTVVISEHVSDYAAASDGKQHLFIDEQLAASAWDESMLRPQEYRLLVNYWMRKDQIEVAAKVKLLPRILTPILKRRGETITLFSVAELELKISQLLASRHNLTPPPPPTSPQTDTAAVQPQEPFNPEPAP